MFASSNQEANKTFETDSHIFYQRINAIEIHNLATITRITEIPPIFGVEAQCDFYRCFIVDQLPHQNFDTNKIYLDADTLSFPLTFRQWEAGDKMSPNGMNGRNKKISDMLNEQKLLPHEKTTKQVLTCGETIIWAVGNRIGQRFAVTDKTERILCIEFLSIF